jgi:hypothetical protein
MAGPGTRRDSRETAVQVLFVRDMHGGAVDGDASMVLDLREVGFRHASVVIEALGRVRCSVSTKR